MTFGEKLRQLRKGAGLSVKEMAKAAGISEVACYLMQRGNTSPKFDTAIRLARALGVSTSIFEDCVFPVNGSRTEEGKRNMSQARKRRHSK